MNLEDFASDDRADIIRMVGDVEQTVSADACTVEPAKPQPLVPQLYIRHGLAMLWSQRN